VSKSLEMRDAFLAKMGPGVPMYALFDRVPGVSFFAKDKSFHIVAANQHFIERFGYQDESDIVGKTDFDLFPAQLAETFRRDDEQVLHTAQPKLHIVELFFNRQGLPDWFVTDKLPVLDRRGRAMGVMGIVRAYGSEPGAVQLPLQIARAVEHIRQHFRDRLTVEELAALCHLSVRQLHRRFVEAFGFGAQAMILKLRVQAACELLRDANRQIGEVAREVGLGDQSSFTQHFHRHMGITPLRYRRRFG
jgi:PAS domain S-box-containing protein